MLLNIPHCKGHSPITKVSSPKGFLGGTSGKKNPLANAGNVRDTGSMPGLGRSLGGGHGNPLQYSCLEIPQTEKPGGLQSVEL